MYFEPLVLTPSRVLFSTSLATLPASAQMSIARGQCTRFPSPWQSLSGLPGVEIKVSNNSVSAPIAPILMDQWVSPVDGLTYYCPWVELTTVQPGAQSAGTGDNGGELVAGLPVSTMILALMYLSISTAETRTGFTADVEAWGV